MPNRYVELAAVGHAAALATVPDKDVSSAPSAVTAADETRGDDGIEGA